MGLENIQRVVLATANEQSEHIVQAAQEAADAKIAAFRDAETQACERRFQAATRAIEEELSRLLIQQRSARNKTLLEKRNACLARLFTLARAHILDAPAGEYAALMRALLEKTIDEKACRIRVHRDDEAVFADLIAEMNKQRPPEERISLDATSPLPQRGGFTLVSDRYEIDQTLETMMAGLEREMAPRLAAQLFGAAT
ncbi:MAG TPA: V-type ATP synthase subunit E family protein [Candidatus Hydrogenedentes bacterium]|nr:V-type ATP synthase subunit E family protein [Candidatus Hydrogenedentota bacterium]